MNRQDGENLILSVVVYVVVFFFVIQTNPSLVPGWFVHFLQVKRTRIAID